MRKSNKRENNRGICPYLTSNEWQGKEENTGNAFSLIAYETRINAMLFNGEMNTTQRHCVRMFSIIHALFNHIKGTNTPISYLAYALATTYHETAFTMNAIEEIGKGAGHPYGEPNPSTGQCYYGRGYVQLTWYENYKKAKDSVFDINTLDVGHVDFLNNPEKALIPFYAVQIILLGMTTGWFTGKKLSDYLDGLTPDYVNARRIVNGTDDANTIATYALDFESACQLAVGKQISRATLQKGMTGGEVRELQLALDLNPDGIFGENTRRELMAFQHRYKLSDDGICGKNTWKTIEEEVYNV